MSEIFNAQQNIPEKFGSISFVTSTCCGSCDMHIRTLLIKLHISCEDVIHGSSYEGRLQSSLIHLITPSRNFVEVR
jgi:hypothetical protein